jgi:hypothetical protein
MQAREDGISGSGSVEEPRVAGRAETGPAFEAAELPVAARLLGQPTDTPHRRIRHRRSSGERPRQRSLAPLSVKNHRPRTSVPARIEVQLVAALQEHLADMRRRLDEAERERAELRGVLAVATQSLAELADRLSAANPPPPPAPGQPPAGRVLTAGSSQERAETADAELPLAEERQQIGAQPGAGRSGRNWWPKRERWIRSLGAGCIVVGVGAILTGFAPRLEMARQAMERTGHLGDIVGALGVLVLIIGLALAF